MRPIRLSLMTLVLVASTAILLRTANKERSSLVSTPKLDSMTVPQLRAALAGYRIPMLGHFENIRKVERTLGGSGSRHVGAVTMIRRPRSLEIESVSPH